MPQIKQTCSVTSGSQIITIAGVNLSSRVRKNHIFMVEGSLVPYFVATDSTYDGTNTTVTLTGAYAGATDPAAKGVFAVDATYPDMVPTLSQGDVGTAAIFTQAMYRLQDMIKAVNPSGFSQYSEWYNAVGTMHDEVALMKQDAADSAAAALASQTATATSESNAQTYKSAAETSASAAQAWATQATGEVVVGQGYSAKKYAGDAATSASNAATSASAAATSKTQAGASETNAAASATSAANSKAAAATSESNAAASKTAAATSATNAAASETNALASKNAAAASATSAATSETNAAASATRAATSETNAAASETAAAASQAAAATSQTAAAASQSAAAASQSAAATSEANALALKNAAATSEQHAQTSETNAATSAANAATSEANSLVSEHNAATSASNAVGSESRAATSEQNAAASASAAATSESNAAGSATSADQSSVTASTKAGEASSSAAAAATSESNAATSAQNAAASESVVVSNAAAAATSEQNARTSETNAANSAMAAATSESNAATSASDAANSASQAYDYLQQAQAGQVQADWTQADTTNKGFILNKPTLAAVATSGSKADIGLDQVENKSSATIRSEITSSNVTTALGFTPADSAKLGAANGIATLGSDGKVPSAQLPSFVDDVVEVSTYSTLPGTGETSKIYVTDDTNKTYRWSGSQYVEISASPGTTDAVPEGSTNKYFNESRVLNTILAGFSAATNAAASASDSVLGALGKLQAQISAALTSIATKAPIASPSFNGDVVGDAAFTAKNGQDGQVDIGRDGNGAIELGKGGRGSAGTPFIDFHSSQNSGDYDVRVMASGGSSSGAGQGTLNVQAATFTHNNYNVLTTGNLSGANVTTALGYTPPKAAAFLSGQAVTSMRADDLRTVANPSTQIGYPGGVRFRFACANDVDGWDGYADVIDLSTYTDNTGGGFNALYFNKASQYIQHKWAPAGQATWNIKTLAYTDSSITGNAASATKLQTARTINGVSFDGSSNITVADSTKLALDGSNSMTGTLTTRAPGIGGVITSMGSAPVRVPNVTVDGSTPSFTAMMHGSTQLNNLGYIQHINIGSYRPGVGAAWGGAFYVGIGGNDNYPTENFLLNYGGEITHSSGKTFLNSSNLTTYTAAKNNPSFTGTATITGGRPVTLNSTIGTLNFKGDSAGWAMGMTMQGSGGTQFGGFWGWGGGDTMSAYTIGDSYDSGWFTVLRSGGKVLVGSTTDDGSGAKLQVNGGISTKWVNGEAFNRNFSVGASGSHSYMLLATLPASTIGTYDSLVVDAVIGGWESYNKAEMELYFANRGWFTYSWDVFGNNNGTRGIRAYQQTDGSVQIWMYAAAGTYSTCNASVRLTQGGVTIGTAGVQTADPSGTVVFDTASPTQYVPRVSTDFAGASVQNGRVGVRASDSGRVLESFNSTATGAPSQFYIDHSLGNVVIGNSRGSLTLNGNASTASGSSGTFIVQNGGDMQLKAGSNGDIGDIVFANNDGSERHRIYDSGSGWLWYRYNGGTAYKMWNSGNMPLLAAADGYSQDISGTDLNTLTKTGFYRGSGFANAPGANGGWFYVTVEGHATDNMWAKQTATTYGSGNTANASYVRTRYNGTWTGWVQYTDGSGYGSEYAVKRRRYRYTSTDSTSISNITQPETGFDYDTGGSGVTGPFIHFGGLGDGSSTGNYGCQIVARYSDGNVMKFRVRNDDTGTWNSWKEVWHSGNLPIGVATIGTTDLNTQTTAGFYGCNGGAPVNGPGPSFGNLLVMRVPGFDTITQIYGDYNGSLYMRSANNIPSTPNWRAWRTMLDSTNYASYAPSLTGGGASGTWGISVSGTAGNASSVSSATGNSYTWTDTQYMKRNFGSGARVATASDNVAPPLQVYSDDGGPSVMTFHRSGAYAINFGLDTDNSMRLGGWSAGSGVTLYTWDPSGNFTASGNVTAYSDERLKTNWRDIAPDFIESWANVKCGVFDRIDTGKTQVGLGAQSVRKILPNAVDEDCDGHLSLNYGAAAAVASVELAKEVNALKETVAQQAALIKLLMEKVGY